MALRVVAGLALLLSLTLAASPASAQQNLEADVLVAEASVAYEAKRFDEALGLLQDALRMDPRNVDALYHTGLIKLEQGHPGEAVRALEQARALAPDDPVILYRLGLAYVAEEDFAKAEPVLARAFQLRPTTEGAGVYLGYARYRNGNYQGALDALRAETSTDPNLQQMARLYSSLSLARLGRAAEAEAEADQALRVPSGTALTGMADRLRAALTTAPPSDRRFRADVYVGFLYDTNVPVLPQPSHDPLAESIRRPRDRHSIGELAGLNLEYSWLRQGPWESTVRYSLFQVWYNDLPRFNLQDHLGAIAGYYKTTVREMPYRVGLEYAYDYVTLGGDAYLGRHTVSASVTLVEDRLNLTALQARFQDKDFSEPNILKSDRRSGQNVMLGFLHFFRFAEDKHNVHVGYQLDVEDTEGRNWEYVGHRLLAGGLYTLPWGDTRLRYDFELHQRDYSNTHSFLPLGQPFTRKREDTEQVHTLRVEKPLPYDFTLIAQYQITVVRSNLPVFSFDRNAVSLILGWRY